MRVYDTDGNLLVNSLSGGTVTVSGTVDVDTINNPVDVNILADASGLATDATLTDGTQMTQITDGATEAEIVPLTNFNGLAVAIVDGNGDQITSFGGGTQYTDGDADATPTGTVALGFDGANVQALSTDNTGKLNVNLSGTVSLPTGASTEAEQIAQTALLGTIDADTGTIANAVYADGAARGSAIGIPIMGDDGTNIQIIKANPLNVQLVSTDVGIVTNSVIHGLSTGGGGTYVDVKVTPSGALATETTLSAGTAVIGHVITDSGSTTAVTGNVTVVQPTGTNLHTVVDSGAITETNSAAIKTAVEIMDDWDESDRAKVNPIAGQAGVAANDGATSATTQRVVMASNTVSTVNSSTANLGISGVFIGTGEDLLSYNEIRVSVYSSHASATDGLTLQQSSDNATWRTTDTFSVPATTFKTFSIPRQLRYFRVVYANGAVAQTTFDLSVSYIRIGGKSSSNRPSDAYSNDVDLEQNQAFLMVWNGTTWDRLPGTTAGLKAYLTSNPGGSSIIGKVSLVSSGGSNFESTSKTAQSAMWFPVQNITDTGRTAKRFYCTAHAAAATTVEQMLTLTNSSQDSATATGTSFTPTSGKTFRITAISFATRGHNTATAQVTTFRLRLNTAGAAITTSTPILLEMRCATPATANSWDRVTIPIDDGIEIYGDGTKQWGMSSNSTYTTNAPTLDVTIIGYEY